MSPTMSFQCQTDGISTLPFFSSCLYRGDCTWRNGHSVRKMLFVSLFSITKANKIIKNNYSIFHIKPSVILVPPLLIMMAFIDTLCDKHGTIMVHMFTSCLQQLFYIAIVVRTN
ncbi:hypothetical protein ACOSP7_018271 [Xanthoceras sorbifolium]